MSYGIENGQIYDRADGEDDSVVVVDCDTYSFCDDVVIRDKFGNDRRIDAWKLAKCRYTLRLDR